MAHISNQNLPEEKQEKIKHLMNLANTAQRFGTSKRTLLQVKKGTDAVPFLEIVEGFETNSEGQLMKTQSDTLHTIDCDCAITDAKMVYGSDYLTGEVLCARHSVPCQECNRLIATHNAYYTFGMLCCARCRKRLIIKTLLLFPIKILKDILFGIVGIKEEERKPAPIDLRGETLSEPFQPQYLQPPTVPPVQSAFAMQEDHRSGFIR